MLVAGLATTSFREFLTPEALLRRRTLPGNWLDKGDAAHPHRLFRSGVHLVYVGSMA
jgi:hypothetical protein